jgi:hypothetical protein
MWRAIRCNPNTQRGHESWPTDFSAKIEAAIRRTIEPNLHRLGAPTGVILEVPTVGRGPVSVLFEAHECRDSCANGLDRFRPGRNLFDIGVPRPSRPFLRLGGNRDDDYAPADERPTLRLIGVPHSRFHSQSSRSPAGF